jgi:hypothetical protein
MHVQRNILLMWAFHRVPLGERPRLEGIVTQEDFRGLHEFVHRHKVYAGNICPTCYPAVMEAAKEQVEKWKADGTKGSDDD